MNNKEFRPSQQFLKILRKKRRKEGLACNLYSHQVGAISIAEEEMTARWAIKWWIFF